MSFPVLILLVGAIFLGAYFVYGGFLSRRMDLSPTRRTPAAEINDGVDFTPTSRGFLLAQHFSAISAAGPIVGPIVAGLAFGWLPVLLWVVIGAVFFGAVHDFSSLVGSVRHGATSIVEIMHRYLGRKGHVAFLIFVWLSLMYVITAFADITSQSFTDPELGGGVASSSLMYLLTGLLMGVALYKWKLPLGKATAIFLPIVFLCVMGGRWLPVSAPALGPLEPKQVWNLFLMGYCFIASVIPVWLLLQPRGYLGGFFLYVTLALGLVGVILKPGGAEYPAFIGFTSEKGLPLFPVLFVTVACGACSGFHGIVCSGTTSKQIGNEKDCRAVGYGGMLLEGLVAVLALSTVMMLAKSDALAQGSPDRVFAEGLATLVQRLGISRDWARSFVLLAFTTFIYDTLDVATRLARQILQELLGLKGARGRYAATALSLVIPFLCVSMTVTDALGNRLPAWKAFWTLFGTSNQLLAALTLMAISLWLWRSKKPWWVTAAPMLFMLAVTVTSLWLMIRPALQGLTTGHAPRDPIGLVAVILLGLTLFLLAAASGALKGQRSGS